MTHFFRPPLTLLFDGIVAGGCLWIALLLRYGGNLPAEAVILPWYGIPYALVCMVVFALFGLHRGMWRYTSAKDITRLLQAITLTLMVGGGLLFLVTRLEFFPRSAFAIIWLLHAALACGPRVLLRIWHDRPSQKSSQQQAIHHALVIGVNDSAEMFMREISRQLNKKYILHGLLDDDKANLNRLVHNVSVVGITISLPKVLEDFENKGIEIDTLILSETAQIDRRALLETAKNKGLAIKRIPSMENLDEGETLTNLKPVLIEDLLGRKTKKLDTSKLENMVKNKNIFITGAGGSIGSELCRQLARLNPNCVTITDNSEHALYQIDMELANNFPKLKRNTLLLDVRSEKDIATALNNFPSDIIFHAAAYKHVPMVEANPIAGIENNLFGTINVATGAEKAGVPTMVIISTDKAVNPTNLMGATKRAAEIFCQNHNGTTRFVTVRFGNVLGSTGSVVPLFQKQIREGGPITVTHKEVTRYFMTIPEAVGLVLHAATIKNTEKSPIFMLDMGEPVKIYDMAKAMIRLSGLVPNVDIEIKDVGLRPGEKLYEELSYDVEAMDKTELDEIFYVKPTAINWEKLQENLKLLKSSCIRGEEFDTVNIVREIVGEYAPAINSPFATKNKGKINNNG